MLFERMFDKLHGWVGTTDRRAGPRWSACSPASRGAPGRRWPSRPVTVATARPGRASGEAMSRRTGAPGAVRLTHLGALRRAARPLGVQLPRRGEHARGAGRGGHPARPACHRADRPRRFVRGGAIRRGRQGAGHGHGVRRGTLARERPPHRGSRSSRSAPAGAGARTGGVSKAVAAAGKGASGRWREGQAALRLRRVDRGRGRALARPHRLP